MDCRIVRVEQGSDEWLDLRRGRITASHMGDVMAGTKTGRYQTYMHQVVHELLGETNVEASPEWARHGREMEPRAIGAYEWRHSVDVEHDIFLIHKDYDWISASPDFLHLPDYDEGGEVKCRALYKNYRKYKIMAEQHEGTVRCVPAENRRQLQTAMWLTGFSYWWYINYYEGKDFEGNQVRRLHRVACPRDEKMIEKIETACIEFMRECYDRAGLDPDAIRPH